ncbi:MAG: lysophospholipid acyltransferase family protein [Myxococcota bacterium]|nr:lysophospholipid acyltransferase family protein [Myxococcota bacterium]
MLKLNQIQSIRLQENPIGQKIYAQFLRFNYSFPPKTKVHVHGIENIPNDRRCILAMNHTDKFNYWPFQLKLYQMRNQFTCTWVKGKYFRNTLVRRFLLNMNIIPVAPKGILIARSFKKLMKRLPSNEEYRNIKMVMDSPNRDLSGLSSQLQKYFGETPEKVIDEIESEFAGISQEVVRLNRDALSLGHHILIFPQGTRSVRLSKGHIGLAQMSQCLGADIIPIGCSGSNICYPDGIPWARKGSITYKIGKPLILDGEKLGAYRVKDPFIPFSADAVRNYRPQFRAITDIVMDEINQLVTPPYQYSTDKTSDGVKGMNRFV